LKRRNVTDDFNVTSLEAINFPEIWEPLQNSVDKGGGGGGDGGGDGGGSGGGGGCYEEFNILMTHKC
jgi:hypothetical protein